MRPDPHIDGDLSFTGFLGSVALGLLIGGGVLFYVGLVALFFHSGAWMMR